MFGFVFGLMFILFPLLFITCGLVMAGAILATGRFLGRHRHHGFCLVVACVECLFMPFGTVLGVFTIITLMKDSVKRLFPLDEVMGEVPLREEPTGEF
jgi:hypothetical protein